MKTLTRNSFLGAMMATALLMSVATMAQNKVTGARRPAGTTTTQTTKSSGTVSTATTAQPKSTTTATARPATTNSSRSQVANVNQSSTTGNKRSDTSTTNTTTGGRRPSTTGSGSSTSTGSVTRSNGAAHWPSSNSVTVPGTSSGTTKSGTTNVGTRSTRNTGTTVSSGSTSSSSNITGQSTKVNTTGGSGTVSGGRRPTSASTNTGTITNTGTTTTGNARPNEGKNIDSRLNNGGNNVDANAGNISANSGIKHGSGNTNIGSGRRPGVDNSNHNAASNMSHYELTNHRNYNTYNNNYKRNDWSRPLPPPTRQYRPAVRIINRPVMPSGFVIYNRAPRINTILGLSFGSYYNSSLNYLFTMGYDIDGYYNDVIYLRDVPMLRFTWADVMLSYDTYGRLYNAQFAHSTSYRDRSRFNRLYHDLYATYGTPVAAHITAYEASVTWFGGNAEGYVTLEFGTDTYGRYYTMVTVGY